MCKCEPVTYSFEDTIIGSERTPRDLRVRFGSSLSGFRFLKGMFSPITKEKSHQLRHQSTAYCEVYQTK